jgi:hypothetical protein
VESGPKLRNLLSLFRSPFIRDTSTLVAGTAVAHLINLALMPILTRLYTSDQFGTFSLYMVVLSIGAVMACLSYEPALVLPEEDQDAEDLLGALIRLAVLMAAVSLLVVLLLRKELAGLLKAPGLLDPCFGFGNILTIGSTRLSATAVLVSEISATLFARPAGRVTDGRRSRDLRAGVHSWFWADRRPDRLRSGARRPTGPSGEKAWPSVSFPAGSISQFPHSTWV